MENQNTEKLPKYGDLQMQFIRAKMSEDPSYKPSKFDKREWGFEASRIKVVGTPYYDATDWQFIRFDCCGMSWLWAEETLYKVFV